MFSKTRKSSHSKRSRKSGRFSIESLERREMLAANFGIDMATLSAVNPNISSQPAAAAAPMVPSATGNTAAAGHLGSVDTQLPVANLSLLGATIENGVLSVSGTNGTDNIHIYASEGTVYVREVVKELTLLTVPAAELTSIVVDSHGGNDWVKVDHNSINVSVTLNGGSGNDTLIGAAANDMLVGGDGNDMLVGYSGNDTMNGGQGDDLLVGGDGNDLLSGNAGDDYLVGGDGNDGLMGEDGNDQLFGEAGNDSLFGGAGQNLLDGGDGDDVIYGGADVDDIYGGNGNDYIVSSAGDDRIRGEAGNDNISGGDGSDMVDGGEGDDTIRGNNGNDALSGRIGNDILFGGSGVDWLSGDIGDDSLYGDSGKDWLQGGYGVDQLDGGSGDDRIYQNYAEGGEPVGQTASAISVGDVVGAVTGGTDAFVGFLNEIVSWTVDRAEMVARLVHEWFVQLDDRILRLGDDVAETLTHFPWEVEFWQGMGHVLVDTLEIAGLGEAYEMFTEFVQPWQRGMTAQEIEVARSVFGESINYGLVRMNEHSLLNELGGAISGQEVRAHATGYIINSNGNISDSTMIHELTHVWQYIQDGAIYIPEALGAQVGEGYEYGGVWDLKAKMDAGKDLSAYNREQQGDIVMDYFDLREEMKSYQDPASIPQSDRDNLDIYIYFVQEVSTLSAYELDVPGPTASHGNPLKNAGDHMQRGSIGRTTSTPELSNVNQVTEMARDAAFAQMPSKPGDLAVTTINRMESLTNGKPGRVKPSASSSLSPVFESALDVVFDSIA